MCKSVYATACELAEQLLNLPIALHRSLGLLVEAERANRPGDRANLIWDIRRDAETVANWIERNEFPSVPVLFTDSVEADSFGIATSPKVASASLAKRSRPPSRVYV